MTDQERYGRLMERYGQLTTTVGAHERRLDAHSKRLEELAKSFAEDLARHERVELEKLGTIEGKVDQVADALRDFTTQIGVARLILVRAPLALIPIAGTIAAVLFGVRAL